MAIARSLPVPRRSDDAILTRSCGFWRACNVPNLSDFRSDSPMIFICWELSRAGGPDRPDHASPYCGICSSRERWTVATSFRATAPGSARGNLLSIRVRPSASGNPVSVTRYARQRSLVRMVRQQTRVGRIVHHEVGQQRSHRHLVLVNLALWSQVNILLLADVVSQSSACTCTKRRVTRGLGAPVRVDSKHNLCVGICRKIRS